MDDNGSVNMSDTSPAQDSPPKTNAQSNGANHLKQKRARSQLSCTPCRQGKLKCNRQHDPACDQCIKRNRESACVFVPPPVKNKQPQNVKGRIRQLESLVVDLMNQNRSGQGNGAAEKNGGRQNGMNGNPPTAGPYSQPTPPSDDDTSPTSGAGSQRTGDGLFDDVDGASTPFGQMKISKDEISYVGESHWGAILDSISDLKRDLNDEPEEEEEPQKDCSPESTFNSWGSVPLGGVQPHATSGLGFMLGSAEHVTKDQLIAGVPEKKVADRLLSLWFNSPDPFKPLIHAPTFQDEYRRFWRSPRETPAMWLGLLFSIMSLAASFGLRDVDPNSQQAQQVLQDVNKYHKLAASAALLGDFTKPKQYTIECLILYSAGLRSNNAFVNVWLMIGLLIRLALRMGYHRDPSHYPAISVFHGEMRRRVWAIISMIDVLISFQLGLPSMVKTIHSDTQPPRNLLDRDFNVSTKILPPSRGIDELTPSSYTRAKLRITRIFADASELSHATIEPSREEVMRLDRALEEAKAAIPPLLKMPDINDLVTDPAEQLMCRFNLDLLYLKTKTVLHRRYMLTPLSQLTPEEQAQGIGYSRLACVDSARRVLQHHHTIYTASQTGGQLESVKWYMGSISTHDFLLAAMIVCLELSTQMNLTGLYKCPQRPALMDALEKSQKIWSDASGRKRKQVQFTGQGEKAKGEHMFDETEKASRAMAVMLEKVKARLAENPGREIEGTSCGAGSATARGGEDAPTPMTGLMRELGIPTNFAEAESQRSGAREPFNGMVSTYQWDGAPERINAENGDNFYGTGTLPQDYSANTINTGSGPPTSNLDYSFSTTTGPNSTTTGGPSNTTSPQNLLPPTHQNANQPDFSMIGDMLDTSLASADNIDWEMWDSTITKGGQALAAPNMEWNDLADFEDPMDLQAAMRAGNALVGGSGPGTGWTPGGEVAMPMDVGGMDGAGATGLEGADGAGIGAGGGYDFGGTAFNYGLMGDGQFDMRAVDFGDVGGVGGDGGAFGAGDVSGGRGQGMG